MAGNFDMGNIGKPPKASFNTGGGKFDMGNIGHKPPKISGGGSKPRFSMVQGGQQFRGGRGGPVAGTRPEKSAGGVAGWLGSKLSLAGHDLASMPGGIYAMGKQGLKDQMRVGGDLIHGHLGRAVHDTGREWKDTYRLGKGMVTGAVHSVEHPLRDPFMTGLNVAPVADVAGRLGEAGLAARGAEGGIDAARAAAKAALAKHGGEAPRTLHLGDQETNLIPSRNAGARLVQRGYDRVVQKAIDKEQSGAGVGKTQGRIASHGLKRIKGAMAEEQRISQRMNDVPAAMLDRAASRLRIGHIPRTARENQAALELTSTQTMPEEAARYHEMQAERGINPEQNAAVARLYRRVQQRNLVHLDTTRPVGEHVHINPAEKHLALTDERMAKVGNRGDAILVEHGQMSPAGAEKAINAPGLFRTNGNAAILKESEARIGKIEKLHAKAMLRGNPVVAARMEKALAFARDRHASIEQELAGETRPGRTHISYRTSDAVSQKGPAVRLSGPVTGKASTALSSGSHAFTGTGIEHGLIPEDITGMKSRAYRLIARHANTVAQRDQLWNTGSDVSKGTGHEVLLGNPENGAKLGKIEDHVREFLGQKKSMVTGAKELTSQEHDLASEAGLKAALEEKYRGWLDKSHERANRIAGMPAPHNYRWVDERMLKGLQDMVQPRRGGLSDFGNKIGRAFDNVNSAVTAATVYFKVGHTFTRGLTNAFTNIMQGSFAPDELARTWQFEKSAKAELGPRYDEFRQRLMAASGQLGYEALPHEGTEGVVGRAVSGAARAGSSFWARGMGRFPGFDAPFRINSLLYELRKVGYSTPEEVQRALDAAQNLGKGLPAHEWSKITVAFRRADREAISYDRLGPFERNFLSRAIWFYPWVKGSTMFTLRSMVEHPYKMAVLGAAGAKGRQLQMKELGSVPSYEQGLIDVGGSKSTPYTVDMGTFSPMSTAGQLANIPSVPGGLAQQFNPALGAIIQGSEGINQYGEPDNSAWRDAVMGLLASTPEAMFAKSGGKKNPAKMFPDSSWQAELRRYLLGPGLARRPTNKAALAKAARREHAKRYTVYSGG